MRTTRGFSVTALAVVAALALVVAACSGSDAAAPATSAADPAGPATTAPPSTATASTTTASTPPTTPPPATSPADCTGLTPRQCLLPWPNVALTVAADTPTGRRLALPAEAMPTNVDGTPIEVTDQNRADGFSPGSAVLIDVPGVDLERSGVAPSTDIGASLRPDAPIVIVDLVTGDRVPYWAELDAQASSDESRVLIVRPAVALREGHEHLVVVRGLVDASGAPLDIAPSWTGAQNMAGLAPLLADAGLADPTLSADFVCVISASRQLPTVIYGHGLLGSRREAESLGTVTALGLANVCATGWIGMSSDDIGVVAQVLADLGRFDEMADRMVQGLVNFHALGILVNAPDGFASAPEFATTAPATPAPATSGTASSTPTAAPAPALAAQGAVFVGNSQGGILGGAASAITDQRSRVVLGVPGVNYSLLLTWSSNWPQFQQVFDAAYPDEVDRVLAIQVVQLLWDRGENQGYVQHLVDHTFDGVPAKAVLLIEAFGDHQVANVSTEVLARTIGAVVQTDPIAPGRSADLEPLWGIDRINGTAPTEGAVLSLWDFGTPAPPTVNLPPNSPDYGQDPHSAGSREPRVITQAFTWLLDRRFQACDRPCTSSILKD
jgi:hypothetical protein